MLTREQIDELEKKQKEFDEWQAIHDPEQYRLRKIYEPERIPLKTQEEREQDFADMIEKVRKEKEENEIYEQERRDDRRKREYDTWTDNEEHDGIVEKLDRARDEYESRQKD